jgi:hypothetical protein
MTTQTNGQQAIPRNRRAERRTSRQSRQYHAEYFNFCWKKSGETIIESSCALIAAKADLDPHEFEAMLDHDLVVSGSTARKLMLIAQKEVLCAHVHKLPPHWGTLYELTKVPDAVLLAAIEDGTVNPEMERKDAIALKPPRGSAPVTAGDPPVTRPTIQMQEQPPQPTIHARVQILDNGERPEPVTVAYRNLTPSPYVHPPHHDDNPDRELLDQIRNLISPALKARIKALANHDDDELRRDYIEALENADDDIKDMLLAFRERNL